MSISLKDIFGKILETVTKDRHKTHGDPIEQLSHTASLWSAYLRVPVDGVDVAFMMQLQKMSRHKHGELNVDDFDDNLGYGGIAALFAYTAREEGDPKKTGKKRVIICAHVGCGRMIDTNNMAGLCDEHIVEY